MELRKALRVFEREGTAFDIAFLDPPYDREDLYTMALEFFGSRPLLKDEGILVMEHSKRQELPEIAGFLRRLSLIDSGGQLPVLLQEGRVTTAIYPGSFDPLTFGHIDILERSVRLFDHVVIAILTNSQKTPLFTDRRASGNGPGSRESEIPGRRN